MAKDQEEFRESWMAVSKILDENESVPTGFTDYCRDLILYAHSNKANECKNATLQYASYVLI
jgi:hypothetical protein